MKKKGFTVLELLAVVIIIGMIAMISVPIVLTSLNSGKKNVFSDSVDGIIRAVELDNAKKDFKENTYQVENGSVINQNTKEKLTVEGGKEETGIISISEDGTIVYAIHNGTWCAVKTDQTRERIIKDYVEGECWFFVK